MVFGYAYPAYECFKAVEKNKPEIEQLLFWCQYWYGSMLTLLTKVLVAVFTVGERVGDTFISWLPMYSEAKLAFFIYLWYPKTKGTTYVYNVLLRPYIAKHEKEIDLNLLKLRIKAREIGLLFWEKAAIYGQTRFFEILQYFSSHSASLPHSDQFLVIKLSRNQEANGGRSELQQAHNKALV
ncbi:putative HVA22-like protein g [Citrus sinensis]|uniref:HVA22-like protein g n=1 Tax=Citrus sinensis TaxID=2711 RepID=A0ACB8IID9_CITSI|nr:putative HVA22-like protein g [Citrus sinensis]